MERNEQNPQNIESSVEIREKAQALLDSMNRSITVLPPAETPTRTGSIHPPLEKRPLLNGNRSCTQISQAYDLTRSVLKRAEVSDTDREWLLRRLHDALQQHAPSHLSKPGPAAAVEFEKQCASILTDAISLN